MIILAQDCLRNEKKNCRQVTQSTKCQSQKRASGILAGKREKHARIIYVKMVTEDKKGYYFFMVTDSSGCVMPKEIIIFKPSSTDILRGCVSFSGSIKKKSRRWIRRSRHKDI